MKPRKRVIKDVPISPHDGREIDGDYNPWTKVITIDPNRNPYTYEYIETLAHELMHALDSLWQNLIEDIFEHTRHDEIRREAAKIRQEYMDTGDGG